MPENSDVTGPPATDESTAVAGRSSAMSDLMAALAVACRDYPQLVDHATETGEWDQLVIDTARLVEVGEAMRDLVLRDANRRGRVSHEALGKLAGRSKARITQLLRNASRASGAWAVVDANGTDIGWVAASSYDKHQAREHAEVVYDDRAADVRALSGFEVAEAELADEATHAPPRTTA